MQDQRDEFLAEALELANAMADRRAMLRLLARLEVTRSTRYGTVLLRAFGSNGGESLEEAAARLRWNKGSLYRATEAMRRALNGTVQPPVIDSGA